MLYDHDSFGHTSLMLKVFFSPDSYISAVVRMETRVS